MTYQEALSYLSNTLSTPQSSELFNLFAQKQWESARQLFIEFDLSSEVFDTLLSHEQKQKNVKISFVETSLDSLPQDSQGVKYLFRRGLNIFQSEIVSFKSFDGPKVYLGSQLLDLSVIDQVWNIVEL